MAKKSSKGGAAAAPVSAPSAPAPEATADDGFTALADATPAPEAKVEPKVEPEAKPEKPAAAEPKPAKPMTLDEAMEKVAVDMKKGGPAKEGAPEPKVETAPEGSDDDEDDGKKTEQAGDPEETPEPKPKAAEPTPDNREDHPLTPEEVTLLRRSKATEEQIAAYASVPVSQRNVLLAPLRNQAANLDRLFGLPKEQREAALEKERQVNTDQPREDRALAEIRQKLVPDSEKLEAFAKANGLDIDSVKDLAATLMTAPAQVIAELERRDQSRAHGERVAQLKSAGDKTRAELVKPFPKLQDDAEYRALVMDDDFKGLYSAYVDSGLDVRESVSRAMRKAATLRYQTDIQQRSRQASPAATAQARATAEPTRKPRGQPEPQQRPRNVDEAMDRVAVEMKGEG